MGIAFSADEVFEMAERMEQNGAKFYRRAAELHGATRDVEFLTDLAVMEEEHKATFAQMRAALTERMREQTAADPDLEAQLFLDEMADTSGGEGSPEVIQALTGQETLPDILRTALTLERKSIAFYVRIRDMVPVKLGKEKIDSIVAEEKCHVATLVAKLKELAGNG